MAESCGSGGKKAHPFSNQEMLHDMHLAPARREGSAAYEQFLTNYRLKNLEPCKCLEKDQAVPFSFSGTRRSKTLEKGAVPVCSY